MQTKQRKPFLERQNKLVSEKVLSLEAKAVEKYVPDRLLLLLLNALDRRASPKTIDGIIERLEKHLSPKTRTNLIAAADEYVPDTVANSRKISAIVAGVGKYIPDRIIPPESAENWSNLKVKFHIPTLLLRQGKYNPPGD
ncbi:MAG: hypothetical protein FJ004_02735 [Chloroflexi bacterium]|nr:hypothetical protein [Chloroflexota bacterium]